MAPSTSVDSRDVYARRIERVAVFIAAGLENATVHMLTSKISALDQAFSLYTEQHIGLLRIANSAELRDQLEQHMLEIEEQFFNSMAALKQRISELETPPAPTQPPAASAAAPAPQVVQIVHQNADEVGNHSGSPLEKIRLIKFNGDYNRWHAFRDLFTSMVHEKPNLSNVAKFHYLTDALEKDAARVIQGYQRTDANYQDAWEAVCERYENKRLIVAAHLKMLRSLKPLTHASATGIRQLVDTYNEVTRSLKAMDVPVDGWNAILTSMLADLLDAETRAAWELELKTPDIPTLKTMTAFLLVRACSLDGIVAATPPRSQRKPAHVGHIANKIACVGCKGAHAFAECPTYVSLSLDDRCKAVKELRLCTNCFATNHMVQKCTAKACALCGQRKKHHETLCPRKPSSALVAVTTCPGASEDARSCTVHVDLRSMREPQVLLATALVRMHGQNGEEIIARALCDTGSQANLITEECAQRLKLKRLPSSLGLSAVGDSGPLQSKGDVEFTVWPAQGEKHTAVSMSLNATVIRKVANVMPSVHVVSDGWSEIRALKLADPYFYKASRIDVLFGAQVWSRIMLPEMIAATAETPAAQNTLLGWLVFGEINSSSTAAGIANVTASASHDLALSNDIVRFWQLEEVQKQRHRSPEDELCETIFMNTHRIDESGRFVVTIPMRSGEIQLGSSRHTAMRRLMAQERSFARDERRHELYVAFMTEYLALGHMREAPPLEAGVPHYYIPHHAVVTAAKFRVVFDGSCVTSSGKSVNDIQLVGERLQRDINEIIMRFRVHRVALTADVAKMYRQIRVDESQYDLQRILWRPTAREPVKEYQLTTVTYGMRSAPFCAVRALQQCARNARETHPLASQAVLNDFYVDDFIGGADTKGEAVQLFEQLTEMLGNAGLPLCKWASNRKDVLSAIGASVDQSAHALMIVDKEVASVLGIKWLPDVDAFTFVIKEPVSSAPATKRIVTSETARLYDPTGLVAPVVVKAKILIRELWSRSLDWDERLPMDLSTAWHDLHSSLAHLEQLRIPRWLHTSGNSVIEIHGFCDASVDAYAAAVYARVTDSSGMVTCQLLTSKTKIAPLKTQTIPRLELCAALLLAKLLVTVKATLDQRCERVVLWSDSTVVLHWLAKSPHQLKTFVANRVREIQDLCGNCEWKHVPTDSNPADLASRGVTPDVLVNSSLWWYGPAWLLSESHQWPQLQLSSDDETTKLVHQEQNLQLVAHVTVNKPLIDIDDIDLIDRVSTMKRLRYKTALVLRFIHNLRPALTRTDDRRLGNVSVAELVDAELLWIKRCQQQAFAAEIRAWHKDKLLPPSSKLLGLDPFLDAKGVLRARGRLERADLPEHQQHPIILPADHRLTRLLLEEIHAQTLHGGAQLMLQVFRERFFLRNARQIIRHVIHNCVICHRHRMRMATQQMADLPERRVRASRPFEHTGLDYCGPFAIKRAPGRCKLTSKGYVAIFVCMTTRAMHIEVVSDMETETFLAAFQRFVARRGVCRTLSSDNAKTFEGASTQLKQIHQLWENCSQHPMFAGQGTDWRFIASRAAHQGGIWEAGVKSFKHHFRRVIGTYIPTFEELSTLAVRIEGCLNSRPLSALTNDVNDLNALTPGHFLVGTAILQSLDKEIGDVNIIGLPRWRQLNQLYRQFWNRWSHECLNHHLQRPKWKVAQRNIKIGELVLTHVDNHPAQEWPLGRIVAVHPGDDGLVRNVTIQHSKGTVVRPVQKISVLPLEMDGLAEIDAVAQSGPGCSVTSSADDAARCCGTHSTHAQQH